MELSKNIIDGVTIASELSDAMYNNMLNDIFKVVSGKSSSKEIEDKFTNYSEKAAYDSILSFVLEAAKYDVDNSSLSSLLEECRMESNRSTVLLKKYMEAKEAIQTRLSFIGKSFDHLIDVKWRQDFVIKSSNCEKICEPSYVILLKTWDPLLNTEKEVTFSCTMEQLQDLVLKLKDATKCIERNAV